MSNNIDSFDECVAVIFAKLYENFPKPIKLDHYKLTNALCDDNELENEYSDRMHILKSSIKWLSKSDYIWMDRINDDYSYEVLLSPKGLETLKAIPDSLSDSNQNIGERLKMLSKEGAKEAMKKTISIALTESYKYFSN